MKKLVLLFAALALISSVAVAQVQLADIYGTVVLPDGSSIPGVTITLTSDVGGKITAVTSEVGNFRFLKLSPGNYELKFELEGFKTVIRKGIRLSLGKNVTLTVPMETTTIQEEVIVTAKAGVVDTRKTTVGMNVSKEMIQSLPTARNPFTVMALAPGMMMDRVDIGGAESGQQSSFTSGGADGDDTTWNVDGANITDNSAIGAAPAYLNMNAYEEMQITVGANDITAQTGGVQLNFVSKRAGNRFAGDFHLYVQDKAWEMKQDLTPYQTRKNFVIPGINRLFQYGVNFGGPVLKDHIFFMGSYAIQDIHARKITNDEDATWLLSGYAKLNFQFGNTSGDLNLSHDAKKKWGRTVLSSAQQNNGSLFDQDGPGWVYYGAIQQIMGNLMLDAKVAYTDGGFVLDPRGGTINADGDHVGAEWLYIFSPNQWLNNCYHYITNRNQLNLSLNGNYFAENILGGDHEIRFGVDYVNADTTTQTLYPNKRIAVKYGQGYLDAYGMPLNMGEVWFVPNANYDVNFNRMSFFLSDTASFGKLNVNLGLRYDKESGALNGGLQKALTWYEPGSPHHNEKIVTDIMGDMMVPAMDAPVAWSTISPRFSLTYDISGDGKNVLKLSLARYGSQSGNSLASALFPYRETDFYWWDANLDDIPQYNEVFNWAYYYYGPGYSGSYQSWTNTQRIDYSKGIRKNQYDNNYNTPLLDELTLSFQKALGEDLAIGVTGFYKKRHNLGREIGVMPNDSIETAANWYESGTVTVGDTKVPRWLRKVVPVGTYFTNYENDYEKYMAVELVLTKKLSSKWMADASFTYQDWTSHMDKSEHFNQNNFDFYNEAVVAPQSGGSGYTGIYVNSRWMFKLSGLYQLPWGLNLSAVLQSREGYVIPYRVRVYLPGGLGYNFFYEGGKKFGDDRLPNFTYLNLGLEKVFKISDTTSATLFVDWYNVTNAQATLKLENLIGAYKDEVQVVTNPGCFQFGIRVNF
ncbi:MAG: carboxypeptidase regulatory-like domain-containing protein [Acidobacteria bacterium]|nr:carboxypeptidase regulatory-like domain-containing protein [Acidobacteriota bacterium]MBU4306267.1 carboxypeptidase regulatory-like domain-containing protein [Acidobacteriota bacterium]MBU4405234.1 carboxypeptidase regulatory-like domain-containing protein [Acidobacteriota bacterium]MCG2809958.1 carboxypeptidase regulatory-like domain-containing protein [Candidatus Aminicenantes bacterium]